MICSICKKGETSVVDSRPTEDGTAIKKIKSCTDLEASIILSDIEYQKFNDLLKSKKEEIEFIENYIL